MNLTSSNTQMPFISVIIPAYNYAHTVERAILSVHLQLDCNCELIVINDGSTDNTSTVLTNISKKTGSFITLNKPNGGLASTRNLGVRHAKGDFLIFLDADDELYPNAISNIRKHIIQNPGTRFIIGSHCSIHINGQKKIHYPNPIPQSAHDKLKAYLIDKTISISNGACVMHKSIFDHYCYPEHFRNSEDISVFAYVLANFPCTTLDSTLANIYKHDDSLRHNAHFAENVGMKLVEEVFDKKRIPNDLQTLKTKFTVQRLLSLSRVFHEAKRHSESMEYYSRAIKLDKSVLLKWSYLKKFIGSSIMSLRS